MNAYKEYLKDRVVQRSKRIKKEPKVRKRRNNLTFNERVEIIKMRYGAYGNSDRIFMKVPDIAR